jgi:hypothetical protein
MHRVKRNAWWNTGPLNIVRNFSFAYLKALEDDGAPTLVVNCVGLSGRSAWHSPALQKKTIAHPSLCGFKKVLHGGYCVHVMHEVSLQEARRNQGVHAGTQPR